MESWFAQPDFTGSAGERGAFSRNLPFEEKSGKKVLTRGGGFGILTKLSGTVDAEPKRNEKVLDSDAKTW